MKNRHINKTKTTIVSGLLVVASFALGTDAQLVSAQVPNAPSSEREGNVTRESGQPIPDESGDQESTRKHRDPARAHRPDSDAQVTLGGAQYFVEGTIAKIDAEYYFVRKDETDEQIRLVVNNDTNLDCAAMPEGRTREQNKPGQSETMTSERVTPSEEAPQASERQLQQGQRKDETARGAGFRIGQCAFQRGDHVKAEVDDNGKVTTLKYLAGVPPSSPRSTGPSAGTGQLAIPGEQDKPAQLDIAGGQGFPPKEYAVVPLRLGKLQSAQESPFMSRPVVDLHGKPVGSIENLLVDTATGRIEYAVILVAHTAHHLHPIPWSAIKLKSDSKGDMTAVLDTDKHKIHPDVTMEDTADLSPSVKSIVKKMETLRTHEQKKASQRPIERGAVGPHGEAQLGGAGPSGFAGPPSGPAPGFKQEKDRP